MSPFPALERCSDPVLFCTDEGAVRWCNESARRMFALPSDALPALSAFLEQADVEAILATRHFAATPMVVKTRGVPLTQTVMTISLAGQDPGRDRFLLIFKSCGIPWHERAPREDVLAMLTHDLKNPLGAIFGYADALLDTPIGENLSQSQKRVLAKIRATSARSIDLVRNCELLFRLGTTPGRAPAKAVDLNEIVQHVVEYTWRDDPQNPALRVELAGQALAVAGERSQLDRIAANLLSNALKYTPPPGSVRVETRREQTQAVLAVRNSGPIIPPAELASLFERYVRASTGKGIPGTGLGLYITKMTAELLGGSIAVSSDAEQGTVFTVRLPLAG